MANPVQTTFKITGWQGRALWATAQNNQEATSLLFLSLDFVLGIRALVQVVKTAWK